MKIFANGIHLNVEDSGSGDVQLVFLHYWGGTARTWEPVIAALPAGIRTIALDARGWARSDRPDDGYDITTMTDDVEAVIAALGLDRFVLVGHSMGGKVAQLLASRRPAGLAGLVLVAPSPAPGKALAPQERDPMAGAYASAEAIGWTIDNVLAGRPLPPHLREQVIADSLGGADAAKAAWPTTTIAENVAVDLARIEVPVLVIGGEVDKVDSAEMLRSIVVPALPGAEMTVLPDVGHLLPLEAPDALADRIADFTSRAIATPRGAFPRPEDIPVAFDLALNRGDLDAVMAVFHPQATMRMVDGTVASAGNGTLRDAIGDLIASKPVLQNTVRCVLASDDVALLLVDWEVSVPGPDGSPMVQCGTATQVAMRNASGNWLMRISNPLGMAD